MLAWCLAPLAFAENPRDHMISEPESPKLSYTGFMFKGGLVFTYASQAGTYYSGPDSGGAKQGTTTAVFGIGGNVAFDNADKTGMYHFIPAIGVDIYPFGENCIYYHASGEFYFGLSNRYTPSRKERRYFGLGPTLNLLVWQQAGNAVQRMVWGFGMNGGMVFPYREKEALFVELRLKYYHYDTDYMEDNFLMNESFLAIGIGAGYGF